MKFSNKDLKYITYKITVILGYIYIDINVDR